MGPQGLDEALAPEAPGDGRCLVHRAGGRQDRQVSPMGIRPRQSRGSSRATTSTTTSRGRAPTPSDGRDGRVEPAAAGAPQQPRHRRRRHDQQAAAARRHRHDGGALQGIVEQRQAPVVGAQGRRRQRTEERAFGLGHRHELRRQGGSQEQQPEQRQRQGGHASRLRLTPAPRRRAPGRRGCGGPTTPPRPRAALAEQQRGGHQAEGPGGRQHHPEVLAEGAVEQQLPEAGDPEHHLDHHRSDNRCRALARAWPPGPAARWAGRWTRPTPAQAGHQDVALLDLGLEGRSGAVHRRRQGPIRQPQHQRRQDQAHSAGIPRGIGRRTSAPPTRRRTGPGSPPEPNPISCHRGSRRRGSQPAMASTDPSPWATRRAGPTPRSRAPTPHSRSATRTPCCTRQERSNSPRTASSSQST